MTGKGVLKGCAIGCAVVVVISLALTFFGVMKMREWMGTFDDAIETRGALESRYPTLENFTPPLDGRVPAARAEAFLNVRSVLFPECARLTEVVQSMDDALGEMEALDEPEGEPGLKDVPWGALGKTIGGAFSLAPAIGRFSKARNDALLEHEMGLGEYAWLFHAFYRTERRVAEDKEEGVGFKNTTQRVRRNMLEMQRRLLDALEEEGASEGSLTELAGALRAEIEALEADEMRPIWFDGLPAPLAETLAPFEDRARELSCPAIRELELARNEKTNSMSIQMD